MDWDEWFLPPWTGQEVLTNARSTSCPAPRGPSFGERLQGVGAGQKVLRPSFQGMWRMGFS